MELKFLKPTTPSQRHVISINKTNLIKKPLFKNLLKGKKNSSGRNNQGKITSYHKGKGHKQTYRKINFKRIYKSKGIVCSIEYDPNRNTNIALIYELINKHFFYIVAPQKLQIGSIIRSGKQTKLKNGNSLPLYKIPTGYFIHNVSNKNQKTAKIARSAGTFVKVEEKTSENVKLKFPSGQKKFVSQKNYATIGIVSNEAYSFIRHGKAGRSRWLNKRPTVRGVAMNPVDHPNGGGEGRKSGKAITPWGKLEKIKKIKYD